MTDIQFSDLGISAPILRAIDELGFEAPTKIQSAAIPEILQGADVTGQAQTGTGKTAAFGIPLLEKIDTGSGDVQALVICPTRELAVQVTGEIQKLGKYVDGLKATPVYGGQSIGRQIRQLKSGTQVVVGTPGRLIDHLKRGTMKLDSLSMVVLDEADEMLNMGFKEDVELILSYASGEVSTQTIMFSATMSPSIRKIINRWFRNPKMIKVEGKAIAADGVEQYLVEARDSVRTEGICRFLELNDYRLCLIFCNTKRKCDQLLSEMQSRGYSSDALHGDMSQHVRDKVMNKFRTGQIDILIATDVAARGLDVDDIDVVFNYDIPQDPEYYVHRIGRTGRAGRKGVAYTFTSGRKKKTIRYIENKLNMKFNFISLPSVDDVEESKVEAFLQDLMKTLESGGLRPYIEQVEAMTVEDYTPVEVAAALLKMKGGNDGFAPKSNGSSQKRDSARSENNGRKKRSSSRPGNKNRKTKNNNKKKENREDEPFYAHFEKKKNAKKSGKRKRSIHR